MASSKSDNKKIGCIIIGVILGFVVLGVVGILMALAVPAFIQFTRKSQAIEGQLNVTAIASAVQIKYAESCELPPNGSPSMATLPTYGSEQATDYSGEGWKTINYNGAPTEFFQYRFDRVDPTKIVVKGEHDFSGSGGVNHTASITLTTTGKCDIEMGELVVENELE